MSISEYTATHLCKPILSLIVWLVWSLCCWAQKLTELIMSFPFNSLWPRDALWHRSGSTLAWVKLAAWRYQAITWTNADFLSMGFCGIHRHMTTGYAEEFNPWHELQNYTFKIFAAGAIELIHRDVYIILKIHCYRYPNLKNKGHYLKL